MALRLSQEAEQWLAAKEEEKRRPKEEAEKRSAEEETLKKNQEDETQKRQQEDERLRLEATDKEKEHVEREAEELRQKEQEEQDHADLEQTRSYDDLIRSSVSSSSTIEGNPDLTLGIELIPFIASQEEEVADLNTIFYDKHKKRIFMTTEKKVDTGEKQGVMVTEKKIVQGADKDPRLMEREGVALALANEYNVDKIMTDLEQYKKTVVQMKETLKIERGKGQSLKRKHEDILSEIEKSKEACKLYNMTRMPWYYQ